MFMIVISCKDKHIIYDHTDNIEDLGANYYYQGDANESQILLNLRPNSKTKFGKTIIPSEVIEYNYNSSYIIAKTKEMLDGRTKYEYWIIDKSKKSDTVISMDSITFYEKLNGLKFDIKLKSRN